MRAAETIKAVSVLEFMNQGWRTDSDRITSKGCNKNCEAVLMAALRLRVDLIAISVGSFPCHQG